MIVTDDRRPPWPASRPDASSVTRETVAGLRKLEVSSPNR
jgi:hypothetical protein